MWIGRREREGRESEREGRESERKEERVREKEGRLGGRIRNVKSRRGWEGNYIAKTTFFLRTSYHWAILTQPLFPNHKWKKILNNQ